MRQASQVTYHVTLRRVAPTLQRLFNTHQMDLVVRDASYAALRERLHSYLCEHKRSLVGQWCLVDAVVVRV